MTRPAHVFMDCDGVFFDSNAAKTEAFRRTLAPFPADAVARFERVFEVRGAVSRYEKLRFFFTEVHPVNEIEAEVTAALARFGAASFAAYLRLQPREEALRFVERVGAEQVTVVSGADQEELRRVFSHFEIADRVSEICGSPTTKADHIRRRLEELRLHPGRTLMIGDGRPDFDACREVGVPFWLLTEMSDWTAGPQTVTKDVRVFSSWNELLEAWAAE